MRQIRILITKMEGPNLHGEKIYLKPLTLAEVEGNYPKWFDDPDVCKYNDHIPFTKMKQDFVDYVNKVSKNKDEYVFAIFDKQNNKHIGNVSLQKINYNYKNAELAIIIGEKDYWGKGVGREAWSLVMNFGFNNLNLHRLYCGTHAENIGMQKIAEACGMHKEGVLKQARFKNGKYVDVILYGALKE